MYLIVQMVYAQRVYDLLKRNWYANLSKNQKVITRSKIEYEAVMAFYKAIKLNKTRLEWTTMTKEELISFITKTFEERGCQKISVCMTLVTDIDDPAWKDVDLKEELEDYED